VKRVELNRFGSAVQFADGFVGCEALEGLQSSAEVVGLDEIGEVPAELVVGVVVEALDGCFLDSPVHAFDLAVGPRVSWFGEPVVDVGSGHRRIRKHAQETAHHDRWRGGCRWLLSRCSRVR
jgi:hypothetical protein